MKMSRGETAIYIWLRENCPDAPISYLEVVARRANGSTVSDSLRDVWRWPYYVLPIYPVEPSCHLKIGQGCIAGFAYLSPSNQSHGNISGIGLSSLNLEHARPVAITTGLHPRTVTVALLDPS